MRELTRTTNALHRHRPDEAPPEGTGHVNPKHRTRRPAAASGLAAAVVLLATACGGAGAPAPTTPPATTAATSDADYAADLRAQIEQLMKDDVIPGAVVLVRSPEHGDWLETFGTSKLGGTPESDPMRVDDRFRIGSNTKTMTVTVVMQLAQEGKLSLDDPIGKYVDGVPNGDVITLAQLAEMRSGLFSYTFDLGWSQAADADPARVWTPQELLDIAFSHPVNAAPGTTFEYSNTNTVLLGLVIEKVAGMPVEQAFQERIFTPLGLTGTSMPAAADASIPDPHPNGYAYGNMVSTLDTFALPEEQQQEALAGTLKPNDVTNDNPSWAWTAGGAISTASDMATYVEALVGGGLLDPAMQAQRMASVQPTDPSQPNAAGYGLGIARFGPSMYGHDGQLPGYMTFMGHDPGSGLTVVVATNLATVPSGEGSALVLAKAIIAHFYGSSVVPGDPAQASTAPTP